MFINYYVYKLFYYIIYIINYCYNTYYVLSSDPKIFIWRDKHRISTGPYSICYG